MSRLPSMPKLNTKPPVTPKELQDAIKQMKKAGQDTKDIETAEQRLNKAAKTYQDASKVSKESMGKFHSTVVDICKTPPGGPLPIPYPIIMKTQKDSKSKVKKLKTAKKQYEDAVGVASGKVQKKIHELTKEMKKSSGNEAGKLKGIVSQLNKSKAKFKFVMTQVKMEGKISAVHVEVLSLRCDHVTTVDLPKLRR